MPSHIHAENKLFTGQGIAILVFNRIKGASNMTGQKVSGYPVLRTEHV